MKTNETSDQEKVPVVNCSTKDCPVAPFCATMAAIATIARRPLLISASNFLDFSCRDPLRGSCMKQNQIINAHTWHVLDSFQNYC